MRFEHYLHIILLLITIAIMVSGCKTGSPVVVDTGDIERLRSEYQQLRSEYERLQSDYKQLTDESKFYADYYRRATEAIGNGLAELGKLGNDSAGEIAKLRSYITVLRNIIQGIIEGQYGERQENPQADGNEQ
jgi:prefoldin subunit 5